MTLLNQLGRAVAMETGIAGELFQDQNNAFKSQEQFMTLLDDIAFASLAKSAYSVMEQAEVLKAFRAKLTPGQSDVGLQQLRAICQVVGIDRQLGYKPSEACDASVHGQ